jgi:hypothetical protein
VEDAGNLHAAFYSLVADSLQVSTIRSHERALQAVAPMLSRLYGPETEHDSYCWSNPRSHLPYYAPGDEYSTLLVQALTQFKCNPLVIQHVLRALSHLVHRNNIERQGGESSEESITIALSKSDSLDSSTHSWVGGKWMGISGLTLQPVLEILQQHRDDSRVVEPAFRLLTRAFGGKGVAPHLVAYEAHGRASPAIVLMELFFGAQDVGEGMLLRIAQSHVGALDQVKCLHLILIMF